MFCPECGKEVKEGKFCLYCGCRLEAEVSEENLNSENIIGKSESGCIKNHRSHTNIKWIVGICVVGLIGVIVFVCCKDLKMDKFKSYIATGEVGSAVSYYNEELKQNEKVSLEAEELAKTELEKLVQVYYNAGIEYNDVTKILAEYSNIIPNEVSIARKKINELYNSRVAYTDAETAMKAGDYVKAQQLYEKVIAEDNNYTQAQKMYKECYGKRKEEWIASVNELVDAYDFVKAIEKVDGDTAFILHEDKQEIEELRNEIILQYQTTLFTLIEEMLVQKSFVQALVVLDGFEENIGISDASIDKRKYIITEYENSVFSDIDQLIAEGDYNNAFARLENLRWDIGETDAVVEKGNRISSLFEEYIKNQVNEKIESREFILAAQILNSARGELPGSTVFDALTELLAEYNPVSIYSLKPYYVGSQSLNVNKNYKDNMGNVYEKTFRVVSKTDIYNVYDISKKYSVLSGVVAIPEESIGGNGTGFIKIYGDGVLLWEDTNITATTKPYEMSVNISGVTDLKIQMSRGGDYNGVHVLFANVMLQK